MRGRRRRACRCLAGAANWTVSGGTKVLPCTTASDRAALMSMRVLPRPDCMRSGYETSAAGQRRGCWSSDTSPVSEDESPEASHQGDGPAETTAAQGSASGIK